jgi:hypothetical protein
MSTLRTITGFKERLAGGGARPNLFEVSIPKMPNGVRWDGQVQRTFNFLCDASSMPASTVDPINVPFRGRILKVAGDRTIDIWSVTVINDEDFAIRTAFEQWANLISKLDNASGATSPSAYMVDAYVHQLGRGYDRNKFSATNSSVFSEGSTRPLRTYKMYDIWPSSIGAIELSYADNNTIERFTVDFQVQWWTVGETAAGASADQAGLVVR